MEPMTFRYLMAADLAETFIAADRTTVARSPQPGPQTCVWVACRSGRLEVQAVDRPDRVPTAGVLDHEVLNAEIAHRSGTSKRERRIDGDRAPESSKASQQTDHNRDCRQRQVGISRHHNKHREHRAKQ